MTDETKVPAIPDLVGVDPNIQRILRPIKEALEIRLGLIGDSLDKAVTLRELQAAGLATGGLGGNTTIVNQGDTIIGDTGDLDPPGPVTNLVVTGSYATIILSWTASNYAYAEIWRAEQDDIGFATLVGQTTASVYADTTVGQNDNTYYYWVRGVSSGGTPGPFNAVAGTPGQTAPNVPYLLDVLTGSITQSELAAELSTSINQIGSNTASISTQGVAIDGLNAKYTVKVDVNGYVSGFGLAVYDNDDAPFSEFLILADRFGIAPVDTDPDADDGSPFFHITSPQMIDGVLVQPGTYMKQAYIADASITNAKIGDAAIDTAQIVDGSILNAKIGDVIQSHDYSAVAGWMIDKTGTAVFSGITIRDNAGNTILSSGGTYSSDIINTNVQWDDLVGLLPGFADILNNTHGVSDGADITTDNLAGSGVNIMSPRYSIFSEGVLPPVYVDPAEGTASLDSSVKLIGSASVKLAAVSNNCRMFFASDNTTYEMPIHPNKKWIVSLYIQCDQASQPFQAYLKTENLGFPFISGNTSATPDTPARYSGLLDLSTDDSEFCVFRFDNDGGAGCNMWIGGIMLEEQVGTLETPSAFAPPGILFDGSVDYGADVTGDNTAYDTVRVDGELAATVRANAVDAYDETVDMSSDGRFTLSEKIDWRIRWEAMDAQYTNVIAQATAWTIDGESVFTTLVSYRDTLHTYLHTDLALDTDVTTDITSPGTFLLNVQNFYTQLSAAINRIADAVTAAHGIEDGADVTATHTSYDTTYVDGTLASTVRANAANALAATDLMISDGDFSEPEKIIWRRNWPGMDAQYNNIITQATAWGIEAEGYFTNLTSARDTLHTYLFTTLALDTSGSTTIPDPVTDLRDYLESFYSTLTFAYNRLSDAAATYGTENLADENKLVGHWAMTVDEGGQGRGVFRELTGSLSNGFTFTDTQDNAVAVVDTIYGKAMQVVSHGIKLANDADTELGTYPQQTWVVLFKMHDGAAPMAGGGARIITRDITDAWCAYLTAATWTQVNGKDVADLSLSFASNMSKAVVRNEWHTLIITLDHTADTLDYYLFRMDNSFDESHGNTAGFNTVNPRAVALGANSEGDWDSSSLDTNVITDVVFADVKYYRDYWPIDVVINMAKRIMSSKSETGYLGDYDATWGAPAGTLVAGELAEDVRDNAADALADTTDMASDARFTEVEKIAWRQNWATIVAQYTNVMAQATAWGIETETEFTTLTSLKDTLDAYLHTDLALDTNTTTDIPAPTSTFITNVENYYGQLTLAVNKIADATVVANTAGNAINICHPRYSLFSEGVLPPIWSTADADPSLDAGNALIGNAALKIAASDSDAYVYLSPNATGYNIYLTPGKKWLLSGHVKCDQASKTWQMYLRTSASGSHYGMSGSTNGTPDTWDRVFGIVDLTADLSTKCVIRLDNDGGAGCNMWFDGIMLEELIGNVELPSAYVPPGMLYDGSVEYGADVTANNTASDVTNVAGVAASTVRDNADNANTAVLEMVDDGQFTVVEKLVWRREWNGMDAQHASLLSQATAWGIQGESVFTLLTTRRDTLYSYLFTDLALNSDVTTPITSTTTFETNVTNFYDQLELASLRIADASTAAHGIEDGADVTANHTAHDVVYVNGTLSTTITQDLAQALTDASTAQTTADGKIQSFYQDNAPSSGMSVGDLWIDTNDGDKLYRYSGSAWVDIQDSGISDAQQAAADAISAASTAQGTADGKITTFVQEGEPTAEGIGDLWFKPSTATLYWWSGTNWSTEVGTVGATWGTDITGQPPDVALLSEIIRETFEYNDVADLPWTNYAGLGEVSITEASDAATGGKYLTVGNNSGNDQRWYGLGHKIPYDPGRMYRLRFRVRTANGVGKTYLGVLGFDADGNLYNSNGDETYSNQFFVALSNSVVPVGWTEYEAYISGTGTWHGSTSYLNPSPLLDGVKYIAPMFLVNYPSASDVTDIDQVILEDISADPAADETALNTAYDTARVDGATAADVKNNASNAIAITDAMADDYQFTVLEKLSWRRTWPALDQQYLTLVTQATYWGIEGETVFTDLDTARDTLDAYLYTTLALDSDVTTAIVSPTTFVSNVQDFYDKFTLALNRMTDAAATFGSQRLADLGKVAGHWAFTVDEGAGTLQGAFRDLTGVLSNSLTLPYGTDNGIAIVDTIYGKGMEIVNRGIKLADHADTDWLTYPQQTWAVLFKMHDGDVPEGSADGRLIGRDASDSWCAYVQAATWSTEGGKEVTDMTCADAGTMTNAIFRNEWHVLIVTFDDAADTLDYYVARVDGTILHKTGATSAFDEVNARAVALGGNSEGDWDAANLHSSTVPGVIFADVTYYREYWDTEVVTNMARRILATKNDLGYLGDFNATQGAPAGTLVGGTAAETVESNAAAALQATDEMASDGYFTEVEKLVWRREWDGLEGNYDSVLAQATSWGIEGETIFTTLTATFDALEDYLYNTLDLALNETTTITSPSSFVNYVDAYYTSLSNAVNRIAEYSTAAGSAGSAVNIMAPRYSIFSEGVMPPHTVTRGIASLDTGITLFGAASLKHEATDNDSLIHLQPSGTKNIYLTPGKKWIISMYVYCNQASKNGQFYFAGNDGLFLGGGFTTSSTPDEWYRVSKLMDLSAAADTMMHLRIDNDGGAGCIMYYSGIMIEQQIGDLETPSAFVPPGALFDGSFEYGATDGAEWGVDITGQPGDFEILNNLTDGSVTHIAYPDGGSMTGGSGVTGCIVVTLPQSWTSTMMRFFVDIYLHDGTMFSLAVGGYNYAPTSTWNQTFAKIIGSIAADNRVRFGHDGTKCCIIIGETTSVWAYPKVQVRSFQAGYSNYDVTDWETGWSVGLVTDLSGYTITADYSDNLLDAGAIVNQGDLATVDTVDWDLNVDNIPYEFIFNNSDAAALGFNPTFSNWTGTYPENWAKWSNDKVTKETSIKRIGEYSIKFTCDGTNAGLVRTETATLPANTFLAGTVDIYIESRTTGYPGLLIDVISASGNKRTTVHSDPNIVGSSQWQRIPFIARGYAGETITSIRIYIMATYTTFGLFEGVAYVDNLQFALLDEALDAATVINGGLEIASGGLVMNGGGAVKSKNKDSSSDNTAGFFLGWDTDDYKMAIGDADKNLKWDGTSLSIAGELIITDNIVDYAVTIPVNSYVVSLSALNSASDLEANWHSIHSASITSAGSPILLTFTTWATFTAAGTSPFSAYFLFKIERSDGTDVYVLQNYVKLDENTTYLQLPLALSVLDTPGAGSETYTVYMQYTRSANAPVVTCQCSYVSLTLLEVKK